MQRPERVAPLLLILLGVLRIAATWNVFSATADEGMHLVAGLQVLDEHRYDQHLVNPPLPRVLTALGPHLAGARFHADETIVPQARAVFHATGNYKTILTLARAATLLFFILGAWATWAWARRELDEPGALFALIFFTTQPSILGHSGLATLDVAGTAALAVAMLAFSHWLDAPTWRGAAWLGAAFGFSIACKLLCIVYVPLACLAIYLVRGVLDRWRSLKTIAIVPFVAMFVVWAGYGFSFGRDPWIGVTFPMPAPAFVHGLVDVIRGNESGLLAYALGQVSQTGWWWYFPFALAIKTTLGALLVVALGAFTRDRRVLEPLAATLAILAFSTTTHVHIGVRYILPVYVPLCVAAGAACTIALAHRKQLVRGLVKTLIVWHLLASTFAHPDYVAYFNEIAVRNPSYFLVDSNLDWGQDLLRLRDEVRREHIDALGVNVFGGEAMSDLGFPPLTHVDSNTPTTGWIAVSEGSYRVNRVYGGFAWLRGKPYRRIGKSIRLYHVR